MLLSSTPCSVTLPFPRIALLRVCISDVLFRVVDLMLCRHGHSVSAADASVGRILYLWLDGPAGHHLAEAILHGSRRVTAGGARRSLCRRHHALALRLCALLSGEHSQLHGSTPSGSLRSRTVRARKQSLDSLLSTRDASPSLGSCPQRTVASV